MYEVILYAAIATIVCAMLYSVLGKSVGMGSDDVVNIKDFMAPEAKPKAPVEDPVENTQFPDLAKIRQADPSFTTAAFIDGAKGAYGMILEGFAEGDKEGLKELLTPDVFAVYEAAINEREAQKLTQVTDLARLIDAEIVEIESDGKQGRISVKYQSDLASALVDENGETVEGDPNILARVSEVWSFERNLKSKDPNWLLADVAPSEGDELSADPTPDTTE